MVSVQLRWAALRVLVRAVARRLLDIKRELQRWKNYSFAKDMKYFRVLAVLDDNVADANELRARVRSALGRGTFRI